MLGLRRALGPLVAVGEKVWLRINTRLSSRKRRRLSALQSRVATVNEFSDIAAANQANAANRLRFESRFAALEMKFEALADKLGNAIDSQLKSAALSEKLSQIENIEKDLDELKKIILVNPAKALLLPLMQKDIAEIEKRRTTLAAAIQAEVGRIYDFSKWFLALMSMLAVGLVTMGVIQRSK